MRQSRGAALLTLRYPAAAHHLVAAIEDGRLSRRDRALRLIKSYVHAAGPEDLNDRSFSLVPVADANFGAHGQRFISPPER